MFQTLASVEKSQFTLVINFILRVRISHPMNPRKDGTPSWKYSLGRIHTGKTVRVTLQGISIFRLKVPKLFIHDIKCTNYARNEKALFTLQDVYSPRMLGSDNNVDCNVQFAFGKCDRMRNDDLDEALWGNRVGTRVESGK